MNLFPSLDRHRGLLLVQSASKRNPHYQTLERDLIEFQEQQLFELFVVVSLHKKASEIKYTPQIIQQFPNKVRAVWKPPHETHSAAVYFFSQCVSIPKLYTSEAGPLVRVQVWDMKHLALLQMYCLLLDNHLSIFLDSLSMGNQMIFWSSGRSFRGDLVLTETHWSLFWYGYHYCGRLLCFLVCGTLISLTNFDD